MEVCLKNTDKTINNKEESSKEVNSSKNNLIHKEQYCLKMLDYMVF